MCRCYYFKRSREEAHGYPAQSMRRHRVDRMIGNYRNDSPECVAPIGPDIGV